MRSAWGTLSAAAAAVAFAMLAPSACGPTPPAPPPPPPPPVADAGRDAGVDAGVDAGIDGGMDAGVDAGTDAGVDAGVDAGMDAGTTDAGVDAGIIIINIQFPSLDGWRFFGAQNGGPDEIFGATADAAGNIWVAGGEGGLYLLKPGSTSFQRFTMADGLRPYGYMPDGGDPPGTPYLKVISVAGGPAGTVFAGYEGKHPPPGVRDCEANWDTPSGVTDPSIYKSGDADKVVLQSDGTLKVVHYDIFSGPGVVRDELRGREKLCNILRIVYDPTNNSVWFGGNHGFARGFADFAGNPTCNGQISCAGVWEHVHPAIQSATAGVLLTDSYYGISVDAAGSGDVWFGGIARSTRFYYGRDGNNPGAYWQAQVDTENNPANILDLWPDAVPNFPTDSQIVWDAVSGMASMPDGSVWVSSYANGLAHLNASGGVIGYLTSGLAGGPYISALARDRWDGSLWTGARWEGGITRLHGSMSYVSYNELGEEMSHQPIWDIQADRWSSSRRMLFAFRGYARADGAWVPGAIGIYTGN